MAVVQQMRFQGCHSNVVANNGGGNYALAAVVISLLLHIGVAIWWFAGSSPQFQQESAQTVSVDLIASPAPVPQPVSPVVQQPVAAEPEQLNPEDMAEQIKVTRKPVPEKKQVTRKVVEKASTPVPASVQPNPATAAPNPASAQISAARYDADYLNNPPPTYPPLSRRLGEEGRVILRVQVSAEGKPLRVELKSTSGFERLDNAAKKAAEGWRFVPAKQAGMPVMSWVEVPLQFSLKK